MTLSALRDDLDTARHIVLTKRRVRAYLRENAKWCQPGLWYVEGSYARHRDATLPEELSDAFRGIWLRRRTRALVERVAPPWFTYIHSASPSKSPHQCSIAYFSHGGNWKLFDFDNYTVWTRSLHPRDMLGELARTKPFREFFNIPPSTIVRDEGWEWRSDRFIPGASLARSSSDKRVQILKTLLEQYADLLGSMAMPPSPGLTAAAIEAIEKCAPHSLPSRITRRFRLEMQSLGSMLRLVPGHGDMSAQNIFVWQDQPWIIDWDTAGSHQPALYDILHLMLREAELGRSDLLEIFLGDSLDPQLDEIFQLAGVPAGFDKKLLLVHGYIVHFHVRRRIGRRDATRQNVENFWNSLQLLFPHTAWLTT